MIYTITLPDNVNFETDAQLPTEVDAIVLTVHIRRCFGLTFMDVYENDELLIAGVQCRAGQYVFSHKGYYLKYIDDLTLEWKPYDLA